MSSGSTASSHPIGSPIELPGLAGAPGVVVQSERIPGEIVQLVFGYDVLPSNGSDGAFLVFFDDAGREKRTTGAGQPQHPRPAGRRPRGIGGRSPGGDPHRGLPGGLPRRGRPQTEVYSRRFSLAGEPLTPAVRVNSYIVGSQGAASVAKTPNGGFVAVWASFEQDSSFAGICGRRFKPDGAPAGPDVQVNQVTFSDQLLAQIASDVAGDFVVVWKSFDPSSFGLNQWDIKARLYRADGRPVGPEVYLNSHIENSQEDPLVAFAPNGTFVAPWSSNAQVPPFVDNTWDIFARHFSASRGDEPCILGNGGFRCDTGRTGGALEVEHLFGGGAADQGFLGDVDGDGRDDPCVYSGGISRCDTDHEGGRPRRGSASRSRVRLRRCSGTWTATAGPILASMATAASPATPGTMGGIPRCGSSSASRAKPP